MAKPVDRMLYYHLLAGFRPVAFVIGATVLPTELSDTAEHQCRNTTSRDAMISAELFIVLPYANSVARVKLLQYWAFPENQTW